MNMKSPKKADGGMEGHHVGCKGGHRGERRCGTLDTEC
jgi:hypothetical protein